MQKLIRRVGEWGIRPETPTARAQHYRLTNVLLLFMFLASIGQTALFLFTGAFEAAAVNSSAPFVFALGLYLMKSGYTVLARALVLLIAYSAGYVIAASVGRDSYFQLIFLFSSAFAIAFFSSDEKWLRFFGLAGPLGCFIALELTDYQPVLGFHRVHLSPYSAIFLRISSVTIIWFLMTVYFYYFIRDRRRSQEQLVSTAKMVALGRMAAGIAHEVNNPLQLIVSHAERLKGIELPAAPSRERIVDVAEQIQSVAMRIGLINKGLLALSRDATGAPFQKVSVRSIVNLSLDLCRARLESHQVELRIGDISSEWEVLGQETQLSEVILNVLNNAFDAVIDGPQKWIQLDVKAEREWVEVVISDSGPGVDPKVRPRIFDPFFTTKPIGKGTGLGLSISQGIMAVHNGQIYCDHHSGRGARFVIRIPRAEKAIDSLARQSSVRPLIL